jgi:hypothetical protein
LQATNFYCNLHKILALEKITYQDDQRYEIIAIATSAKDYKATFILNQMLFIQLEKADDLVVDLKAKSVSRQFGKYLFEDEMTGLEYHFICNRTPAGAFLTSLKNFDFLLIIKSYEDDIDVYSLVEKLRNVQEFQAALPVNKLSKKEDKLIKEFV